MQYEEEINVIFAARASNEVIFYDLRSCFAFEAIAV